MTKELLADKPDLEPMATGLAATFFQRCELYAKQFEDGSTICIRKPLEISHLVTHLEFGYFTARRGGFHTRPYCLVTG
jgi:hypothetical protein